MARTRRGFIGGTAMFGAAMMLAAGCTQPLRSVATSMSVPTPQEMRGPFPIMSTPYHEDGSVDYAALAREAQWVDDCGCPGVIWCQSNDAIDLLTREEKFRRSEERRVGKECIAVC